MRARKFGLGRENLPTLGRKKPALGRSSGWEFDCWQTVGGGRHAKQKKERVNGAFMWD